MFLLRKVFASFFIFTSPVIFAEALHDEVDADDERADVESDVETENQAEVREGRVTGVAAGVGQVYPWQVYGVSLLHNATESWTFEGFAGGGHFSRKSSGSVKVDYDIEADQLSVGGGARWYASESIPFALTSTLSLGSISGKVSPRSTEIDTNAPTTDLLTSSFRANLVSLSLGASLSYQWKNSVYIDWNILSFRKSYAFSLNVEREEGGRKREVKHFLEDPTLYGIINFRVGYFF